MSIMSKFKGEKKDGGDNKQSTQEQRPTVTPTRSWTSENMRQINRTTQPQMVRTNSANSMRSSRHRSKPSSLRALSRNTSFQGLAMVMEDGDDDAPHGTPPMPSMPVGYSSSSFASSSKSRASRSPLSSGSSVGKSPLSSAESSPPDSEEGSNTSSKSEDILEMRSHPFSHPQQYVFSKDHRNSGFLANDPKGKGKAPMYAEPATLEPQVTRPFEPLQERKYFTRATPMGGSPSEIESSSANAVTASSNESKDKASQSAAKKGRFSFLKKTEVTA